MKTLEEVKLDIGAVTEVNMLLSKDTRFILAGVDLAKVLQITKFNLSMTATVGELVYTDIELTVLDEMQTRIITDSKTGDKGLVYLIGDCDNAETIWKEAIIESEVMKRIKNSPSKRDLIF